MAQYRSMDDLPAEVRRQVPEGAAVVEAGVRRYPHIRMFLIGDPQHEAQPGKIVLTGGTEQEYAEIMKADPDFRRV